VSERETEREGAGGGAEGKGEADSPRGREPITRLDSRTLRS